MKVEVPQFEETDNQVLPENIEAEIDKLVALCEANNIDIVVHARPSDATGISSTGWCNKRMRAEVFMVVGKQLGIPEEVLGITAMAAMAGHDMKVAHAGSENELFDKLEEIANNGKGEADEPQIH